MCNPYVNQLRFRKVDFGEIPSGTYGVYGIWFRRRCIYVGQAKFQPISKRLEQHWRRSHNPQLQAWIEAKGRDLRVAYLVVEDISSVDAIEQLYIRRFQPLTNKVRYIKR